MHRQLRMQKAKLKVFILASWLDGLEISSFQDWDAREQEGNQDVKDWIFHRIWISVADFSSMLLSWQFRGMRLRILFLKKRKA